MVDAFAEGAEAPAPACGKSSAIDRLRADTERLGGGRGVLRMLRGALGSRCFRPIFTMRLCQWASTSRLRPLLPVFMALHWMASSLGGMELPWRANVGAGFAIHHGFGLVVSPGARIGRNVTMLHGATLGRRDSLGPDLDSPRVSGFPTIEDEVWIGPHAVILGGITIGQGSRIAAGAVVVADVPPHSLVTGNPGRILRSNCRPDVFNPARLA